MQVGREEDDIDALVAGDADRGELFSDYVSGGEEVDGVVVDVGRVGFALGAGEGVDGRPGGGVGGEGVDDFAAVDPFVMIISILSV